MTILHYRSIRTDKCGTSASPRLSQTTSRAEDATHAVGDRGQCIDALRTTPPNARTKLQWCLVETCSILGISKCKLTALTQPALIVAPAVAPPAASRATDIAWVSSSPLGFAGDFLSSSSSLPRDPASGSGESAEEANEKWERRLTDRRYKCSPVRHLNGGHRIENECAESGFDRPRYDVVLYDFEPDLKRACRSLCMRIWSLRSTRFSNACFRQLHPQSMAMTTRLMVMTMTITVQMSCRWRPTVPLRRRRPHKP